ncbi:hypothetical protein M0805_005495 [Coniferiporia weirii]|nr:hypothetical protein M0805_005495 [Coniferiporia weirii]
MPVPTTAATSSAPHNQVLSVPSSNPPISSGPPDPNGTDNSKKWEGRRKPRNRQGESHAEHPNPNRDGGDLRGGAEAQRAQGNVRWRGGGQRRRQGGQPASEAAASGAFRPGDGEASGRSSPSVSGSASARGGRAQADRGQPPAAAGPSRGGGRRKPMNVRLTNGPSEARNASSASPAPARNNETKVDNLTNRLIEALRTPPYVDCPICFNAIHPAQPIWSCSPTLRHDSPPNDDPENQSGDAQCCYTPFHLKCIKSWASKSVKDMSDAYRTRGETGKRSEWRCPGCQHRRFHVPNSYLCFCGSTPDPRPARLATPHSCGNSCSRPRACGHVCPLSCHPGPCPPCQVTTQLPCHCERQIKSFRCADLASLSANGKVGAPTADLSCGSICKKLLNCGRHRCASVCHSGPCTECLVVETSRCYCGKDSRTLKCGEGVDKHSCVVNDDGVLEEWDGRFACESPCGRFFDCGIHKCEKACHPPSADPPPCPRSLNLVTHCPCGKKSLRDISGGIREKCTDPIATCGNLCMKKLEGCEHVCSVPCHTGLCPPCSIPLIIPCRCGSTTRSVPCHVATSMDRSLEVLCDKPCTVLRACGRHQCNRVCCPLAALGGATKGKGKKRQPHLEDGLGLGDEAHWHECDLVCGKLLGCGNHRCEERDHRGTCPPCLRSSFEEMICYCGRTVVEPPIPCGTRISCAYPCSRPAPPCGHPKSTHSCHEDPTPCPPCPFLTTKTCACGKNSVGNVRCSQEKVSCGATCGKLLDCGFHHCERLCHGGDCGTCISVCGKPRKLCLPAHHGCTAPCHAPAACSEDEPCQATITLRCVCGRIQQPSHCGRSTSSPAGREVTQQLKCTTECALAKRNARLAEALGVSQEVKDRDGQRPVVYSAELVAFARANAKFCAVVEKNFSDFIGSERKSQVLPYMHEARRKFVHDLAAIYRMDTQMVDQEPKRSVQLIRRIDTRIPKPLLSAAAAPSSSLGKLADLRTPPLSRPSSASPGPQIVQGHTTTTAHGAARGWTSVVANPVTHSSATASTTWRAPGRVADSVRTAGITQTPARAPPMSRPVPVTQEGTLSAMIGDVPDSWENDDA